MKHDKGFYYKKDKRLTYCDDIKNTGADYSKNLIENNVSHLMLYNNTLAEFIKKFIEPYMVKLVDTVKFIRIYYNIAVDKNHKNIN